MFVFALFNLQGTVLSACRSRGELAYVTTSSSICQELFQVFSNFFLFCGVSLGVARALKYVTTSQFICQELFSSFFKFLFDSWSFARCRPSARIYYHCNPVLSSTIFDFFQKISEALSGLRSICGNFIKECHQLSRNRRHFAYKRPQMFRRYLHRGRRRSYDPAGSSA